MLIAIMMAYRLLQIVGFLAYLVGTPFGQLWLTQVFGFVLFGGR